MKTCHKLMPGLALIFFSIAVFSQEIVGEHYLRNTQVVEIKDDKQDRTYRVTIQTPYGYTAGLEEGKTYPVMVITDMSHNLPMIAGWMNVATWENVVQRHILVGISWEIHTNSGISRSYDYTPIVDVEWKNATGGANAHIRLIKEQVIKYVESNYAADPEKRTYIGYSLGGLFGAYVLLTQPDLFSNYILVSPSLWYDDGYIFRLEASDEVLQPTKPTKVFISAGELETPEDAGVKNNLFADANQFTRNVAAWENENVSIQFYPVKDAYHSMTFPESIVRAIYWMHKIDKNNLK